MNMFSRSRVRPIYSLSQSRNLKKRLEVKVDGRSTLSPMSEVSVLLEKSDLFGINEADLWIQSMM